MHMTAYGEGRTERVTIRFSEEEVALVNRAARILERQPSTWGRLVLLKEARAVIKNAEKEEAGG
jgi:hypothetical protein